MAICLSEESRKSNTRYSTCHEDFQFKPVHMLQAGRQKLKRTQLCTQLTAELGGRLFKKKKSHKLYMEGCGGGGEENAMS